MSSEHVRARRGVRIHRNPEPTRGMTVLGQEVDVGALEQGARAVAALGELHETLRLAVGSRSSRVRRSQSAAERFADHEASWKSLRHDIREPLRSLRGFSARLRSRYAQALDADGVRMLDYLETSAQQLTELVERTLEESMSQSRPSARCSPNVALQQAWDMLIDLRRRRRGSEVRVVDEMDGALVSMPLVDLMRVFLNILTNSLRHGGPDISLIRVSSVETVGRWLCVVEDNGRGLTSTSTGRPDREEADESGGESGLGLGIVRSAVGRFGGCAWLEDRPEGGCRVGFDLPLATSRSGDEE